MRNLSEQQTGILLVTVSAFVFSTAGLFVKSVEAGAWEVIFWRGVFSIGFSLVFVLMRRRFRQEFVQIGKPGLTVGVLNALGTVAFVPAFKLTTIANVTLIYAAAPLVAGVLAWVFLKERLNIQRILAIFLAMAGVVVIVSGSLGAVNISGDLLALWMTCALAVIMVMYRAFPGTPATGPVVVSSLLLLFPALIFGSPFQVALNEIAIMVLFGFQFTIASITLMEGAKRLSAARTALLSILETPLAPLLAWVVLAELPAPATFVGGGLVFAAVIWAQITPNNDKIALSR
ncbi:MAG: DMT family transporter [Rhodobacteraceae bacterium]|nr:DMT family transporter [Paracoccaceae bacterium]